MNTRMLITLAGGALLGVLTFTVLGDQVYKWVDKDGHVHYSQTPPTSTDVQAQQVDINAPPPDPTTVHNEQNLADRLQKQDQQDKDAAKKQQQDAQQQAQQKKHCDNLNEQLVVLNQSRRVASVDAQGNTNYLSDDQRTQQIQDLQAQIAKDCSGGH